MNLKMTGKSINIDKSTNYLHLATLFITKSTWNSENFMKATIYTTLWPDNFWKCHIINVSTGFTQNAKINLAWMGGIISDNEIRRK